MTATPTIVEVEETRSGRFTNVMRDGRHVLTADEPAGVGGNDAGPGPYELLLMSLGACTSMTLRMYAELKKLPLERVRVKLSHRKIHAQDCVECETREGKLDEITREITLEGALTEEQRKRMLEIADKCPVHRTLISEVRILSRLT
jgi:putative redox protein